MLRCFVFCSPQTSPVSVLRPLYRPVPINTQQTLLKNIGFSEHCLAVNTTIFKMKHKQIYSLQNMISYTHKWVYHLHQCTMCTLFSIFSAQPNKFSPFNIHLSQLVLMCGKYIFSHFCNFEILNLSKTLRTPNLYYVIYGRPLMVF